MQAEAWGLLRGHWFRIAEAHPQQAAQLGDLGAGLRMSIQGIKLNRSDKIGKDMRVDSSSAPFQVVDEWSSRVTHLIADEFRR